MRVRLSVLLSARFAVRLPAIATVVLGSAALGATEAPPRTQEGAVTVVSPTLARVLQDVPFAIGESLSYSVKFGFARIGSEVSTRLVALSFWDVKNGACRP